MTHGRRIGSCGCWPVLLAPDHGPPSFRRTWISTASRTGRCEILLLSIVSVARLSVIDRHGNIFKIYLHYGQILLRNSLFIRWKDYYSFDLFVYFSNSWVRKTGEKLSNVLFFNAVLNTGLKEKRNRNITLQWMERKGWRGLERERNFV